MLRWALVFLICLLGLLAVVLAPGFRRDLAAARDRVAAAGAEIADTACGPVEYVATGEGPAVLVVHGIFGGFDQGLGIATGNLGPGYRVVAPSRFGYLGTPMPAGATPEMQADAFACLLDHLEIDRATLFGTSAGSTSVLHFALRHPERTRGLILMSPNAPGEVEVQPMPRAVANLVFRSEPLFWLLTTRMRKTLAPIMGVPEGFALTPDQEDEVAALMAAILPVGPRADGALFDMYVSNPQINSGHPFETLTMPVLLINARDDPLALFENTQALAARLPQAELVGMDDGGHLMLGHGDAVREAISAFLARVALN